ncbi:hypothetical protein SDC9_140682 [bioreactor metagenome]|uniref:Pyridoxamine 5'-phosphate oxidase N-terminal domain-containing protein n=1 Tax=bioreactor metagenome TaxID=1076179 RepID=A0A645DY71_9ZZZZ
MKEVYDFLKRCETYYLATDENGQPRVRPFGTVDIFENKLYIQTGKIKNVFKQMIANPRIEICGMADGKWIRIETVAVEDDRLQARQHMLDAYPSLHGMYQADDGNCQVFYLKDAKATISSFTEAPKVIQF